MLAELADAKIRGVHARPINDARTRQCNGARQLHALAGEEAQMFSSFVAAAWLVETPAGNTDDAVAANDPITRDTACLQPGQATGDVSGSLNCLLELFLIDPRLQRLIFHTRSIEHLPPY